MSISKQYIENSKKRFFSDPKSIDEIKRIREEAAKDPETFWSKEASNLRWFKKWDKVLEWNKPFAKWFVGGKINASYNTLDVQIDNKKAYIWIGEDGSRREITYNELYNEVNSLANGLKDLGIKKGDRVSIYLPMIPELPIAMLACARIGAIHSVIFSGFSVDALIDRINDAESKAVITADGGYRRGKIIRLRDTLEKALEKCRSVEHTIIHKRIGMNIDLKKNEYLWQDIARKGFCEAEEMESESPLFILYTSGTTGKPKGIVHDTGGYLTLADASTRWIFDINDDDVYWCTADIGWVTGHTYVVYGPLLQHATILMYEGAPDYPEPDVWWDIIEKNRVSILYTTPTALRMFMKLGDDLITKHDLSSLRLLGSVGEPINPDVWLWYEHVIGKDKIPIVDTWWQTETGAALLSPLPGIRLVPLKPGSSTYPLPTIDAAILDEEGREVKPNTKGYLVIRKPWPGMLLTIWKDDEKYKQVYWSKFEYYYTGDYAMIDEDGYFWILGRADDVLKVAGHRLGTMEIESALVSYNAVAEAAVSSKPHDIKGESIVAFVVLKTGYSKDGVIDALKEHIKNTVGAIAIPDEIFIVDKLPKTRSGKIMRRLLKAIVSEKQIGDVTTLEDEASVSEIINAYEELKRAL
ncbi:MAG: acetate--CoA ligase [Candidatus Nitrosocaldaceae archaeon]